MQWQLSWLGYPVAIIGLLYLAMYGFLQTTIMHFCVPFCLISSTLKVVDTENNETHRKLLKQWVALGGYLLLENLFDLLLSLTPLYTIYLLAKLLVIIWALSTNENLNIVYLLFEQLHKKSNTDFETIVNIITDFRQNLSLKLQEIYHAVTVFWDSKGKTQ